MLKKMHSYKSLKMVELEFIMEYYSQQQAPVNFVQKKHIN